MRNIIFMLLVTLAVDLSATPKSKVKIKLPISAKVTSRDNSGKGWNENGFMNVTYVLAKKQFATKLRSQNWSLEQYIDMGKKKERCLTVWQKGGQKMTLMIWRVKNGQSAFSWGLNK